MTTKNKFSVNFGSGNSGPKVNIIFAVAYCNKTMHIFIIKTEHLCYTIEFVLKYDSNVYFTITKLIQDKELRWNLKKKKNTC